MEAPFKRGNISESIALTRYLEAGFMVATPFGVGAPYLSEKNGSCGTRTRDSPVKSRMLYQLS